MIGATTTVKGGGERGITVVNERVGADRRVGHSRPVHRLERELAALVRAGVPLERGLIEAGRDLRGRLGAVSTELGRRMGEGRRLPEAIAASGGGYVSESSPQARPQAETITPSIRSGWPEEAQHFLDFFT